MKLTTQNVVKPVLIHPAVVHVPTLQQQQQMIANSKAGLGTPTFGPNGITIPNYSSANTVAVGQTVRGIGGTQIQPNVLPRTNTATSRSSSSTKTKTSASKYTTGLKASGK